MKQKMNNKNCISRLCFQRWLPENMDGDSWPSKNSDSYTQILWPWEESVGSPQKEHEAF